MPDIDIGALAEQTVVMRALDGRLARQGDDESTGRTAVRGFQ